jgi:hypothetical protein
MGLGKIQESEVPFPFCQVSKLTHRGLFEPLQPGAARNALVGSIFLIRHPIFACFSGRWYKLKARTCFIVAIKK